MTNLCLGSYVKGSNEEAPFARVRASTCFGTVGRYWVTANVGAQTNCTKRTRWFQEVHEHVALVVVR